MERDVYTAAYRAIYAVVSEHGDRVELIECPACFGGAYWALHHYSQRSNVLSSRVYGDTVRYVLRTGESDEPLVGTYSAAGIERVEVHDERIAITYAGLGGGGVGATVCRALARGVESYELSHSGGSQPARGTLVLPARQRVLIGIDDTDSKTKGATWSLAHNIAKSIASPDVAYLSHAIVQLLPVPERTQNCTSTVVELGCTKKNVKPAVEHFRRLLADYSLSDEVGMAVWVGFECDCLKDYSTRVRSQVVSLGEAEREAERCGALVSIGGRGLIGALAALPYYARGDVASVPQV
ncbi:MAG: methanogenesis marker protein 11 [Methermicoccaceae archaeon]